MVTTFELKSIVYNIIKASNFKTILNGDIYIDEKPLNSDKNDIVIGSLSIPKEVLLPSTVLINIYAKNIKSGTSDLPNLAVLNNATKLIMPLVDEVYLESKKTYLEIEYQRDYKIDGANERVSVIRLKTRTIN
ncbi:hypothetical protein [Chryseobacterium aquaticum]|uniref:DUF3168 domain-containing protein n=1 Tax=Chryseobacterium aquaticum subsp. greenlandense TaxID=345663 RepID=A0A101CHR6_9FLAO|nr:hypothetical protein [Chryseobacterium aquaticum]KUJ56449.1 hypothetical protein AR686_07760 [Chryseobacterium aquaticum subsp. greenlandense]